MKSQISNFKSGPPLPLCPDCGYDLRGLASDRCPECGLRIDRAADLSVTLPWAHRRTIGRGRAFVRTAAMATFRPRRLAANIARPVSWADAVAFRRATVALAAASAAVALTVIAFLPDADLLAPALYHPLVWWAELLAVPVTWAGLWLALLTTAGVASYWFHPRSISVAQQNRAVALSLYGCGPLALVPLAAALLVGVAVAAIADVRPHTATLLGTSCGTGLAVVGLLVLGSWWHSTVLLLRHTTHCGVARQLCLAVGLPIAWAVLAAVFALGLPLAYLWLALVLKSDQSPG